MGNTTTKPLQRVDYEYNIRGWLKKINDPTSLGNDLFGFGIAYNDVADPTKRLYNGNIGETAWGSKSINSTSNLKSNKYTYSYDALNRITGAVDNTGHYTLSGMQYDKNGNIDKLKRQGLLSDLPNATNFGMMDDLTYAYDGNRLLKVADAATVDRYGFRDDAVNTAADTSNDYAYDANGNMTSDANKGIGSMAYNHLNLPTSVNVTSNTGDGTGTIGYIYDAIGAKLKKTAPSINGTRP